MNSADYWKSRYSTKTGLKHHSDQNLTISRDFLREAKQRKPFNDALSLKNIIEIGCGTGELAHLIRSSYGTWTYYATDFSKAAVKAATKRHITANFWQFDIVKDEPFRQFDLLISSNCLEHFTDPHHVIGRMFGLAPKVMLIVPYQQPVTDGYDEEGGAGHVYEFSEATFDRYLMKDSFRFVTRGWQHSSSGEEPIQLAVLLEQR